jgi:hypothetical protein
MLLAAMFREDVRCFRRVQRYVPARLGMLLAVMLREDMRCFRRVQRHVPARLGMLLAVVLREDVWSRRVRQLVRYVPRGPEVWLQWDVQ